jgi:transcriptional regulator
MKICRFTKPELDHLRENCNFTDEELACFELKAKDYTNTQLAMKLNMSESKVSMVMKRVRTKITKVLGWEV